MLTQKMIGSYIFSQQSCIGRGTFGIVYLGQNQITQEYVAIKTVEKRLMNNQSISQSLNEINSLTNLKNKNIVELIEVIETVNNIYMVSEFCEGGDLRSLIQKGPVSEIEIINIMSQILNAFRELQKQNITHRDLKPANILIKQKVYKIADFGFARQVQCISEDLMQSVAGTPLYMAPQILLNQPYTSKCDIWSIGLIAYELFFQMTPFQAQSVVQLMEQIIMPLRIPKNIPSNLSNFIESCLKFNEEDRIGWDTIFDHPIFNILPLGQKVSNDLEVQKYKKNKKQFVKLQKSEFKQQENLIDQQVDICEEIIPKIHQKNKSSYQTQMIQTYLNSEFKSNAILVEKHLSFIKYLFNFSVFLDKNAHLFQGLNEALQFLIKLTQFTIQKLYNLESLFTGNNWLKLKEIQSFSSSNFGLQMQDQIKSFKEKITISRLYDIQQDYDQEEDHQILQGQFFKLLYEQMNNLYGLINQQIPNRHAYLSLLLLLSQIPHGVNDCTFPWEDVQLIIQYPEVELMNRINILNQR